MNEDHLRSYLNDHLAGATTGLELIDFLISTHAGEPRAHFFEDLRREVEADLQSLRDLIVHLGFEPSAPRQAAAWAMEKLARIKFLLAGPGNGSLGDLEALEALAMGIEGKKALWAALTVFTDAMPLRTLDLARLQQRAGEQRARLEVLRLEAARATFQPANQSTGK